MKSRKVETSFFVGWIYDLGDNFNHFHREDGPAIEWKNSEEIEWYLLGQKYSFEKWLERTPISIEEKILMKLRYG